MTALSTTTQQNKVGKLAANRNLSILNCLGCFLSCVWLWLLLLVPDTVIAQPFIPSDDAYVLERLPVTSDSKTGELRQLRTALSEDPENLELAVEVARRYVELGRAESDPRYYGYAQAALTPWWKQNAPPSQVLIIRATIHQASHNFNAALGDLSRVLRIQPRNPQAWLTRAVILQVRGDYREAAQNCLPLIRLYSPIMATGCMSGITSLSGQAAGSYQRLHQTLESIDSVNAQEQLWVLTLLGEMAVRLGRHDDAKQHFERALSLNLRDTYLLGAYTDFLLDQDQSADVQTLLRDDVRPDGLLLRLVLAEQHLQSSRFKQHVANLRARFAENRLRGDARHLRLEARFTLHVLKNPTRALELALENWTVQREPWDARLLLEAALHSNNSAAAQPVLDWLKSVGLEDVRLKQLVEQLS